MRSSDWSSDVCSSDLLHRAQHLVYALFIAECILCRLEGAELGDVGAGGEGLVARSAQHQRPGVALVGGALANLRQPLVHGKGAGVASPRPVEGDAANTTEQFVEQYRAPETNTCRNP